MLRQLFSFRYVLLFSIRTIRYEKRQNKRPLSGFIYPEVVVIVPLKKCDQGRRYGFIEVYLNRRGFGCVFFYFLRVHNSCVMYAVLLHAIGDLAVPKI